MIGPFTVEALLVVTNLIAMWFTAPCLVRPRYPLPRWVQAAGFIVFTVSFAMVIVDLNLWLDTMPEFRTSVVKHWQERVGK